MKYLQYSGMFCGLMALVVVMLASSTFAEEFPLNDAPSGKQSPMGFGAFQGVKSLTSLENEDSIKRAPIGFQRGKKDFLTPEFADSYFIDEYLKRAPMGFQGMRGKKAITAEDYYKRAAMGFQGMRGKKSSEIIFDEIANYGDEQGHNSNLLDYPDENEKRAPSMGFQGMRGKKTLLAGMNDPEKRAMMGFQGMRGKKSIPSIYYNQLGPHRSIRSSPQKIKRWGFVASRGKRSELDTDSSSKKSTYNFQDALADEIAEDLLSRDHLTDRMNIVPLQFYKRSAYKYSGTRGKKVPRWEMSRKFIGVRGKKWSQRNYEDSENSLDNVRSNNERIAVQTGLTTNSDIQ